jgi:diadenosine tetraphosphatase ApaH/serine/threonine PP2A family protein phosphatase
MRTAIIADIHANLEALTAVLARIKALKAAKIVCLGDMVGYNANPNETLDICRKEKVVCVLGNHDVCAAGLEEPEDFNSEARAAVLWTRERLTGENREFLRKLPRERRVRDFFVFHGSIHDTDRYILYLDDAVENFRRLAALPGRLSLGFFGHTHVRMILRLEADVLSASISSKDLELSSEKRYLINPGSVGQPRDGDPRAAFLVYDDQDRRLTFHSVEYDIRACQEKIIRAGLPPRLAERLDWGR